MTGRCMSASDAGRRWQAAAALTLCLASARGSALAADAATIDEVYTARCAGCHGPTGSSDTQSGRALKVSPLVDDERIAGMTPAEIVKEIRTNPKHRAVVDLTAVPDSELLAAAEYVRRLCAGR